MSRFIANRRLADALMKRGLVPDGCRLIDVQIAVDGALTIRYEKFVSVDELGQFAEALSEVSAAMKAEA